MMEITYRIQGMDCAEEVAALEKTVGAIAGVDELRFDVLNGRMTAVFDEDVVSREAILKGVELAGMKALPADTQAGETAQERSGRLASCITAGVFMLAGFIVHAVLSGSFLHALIGGDALGPSGFPLASTIFYLASVIAGGWYIAPKAILALRGLRADMNLLMTVAVIGAIAIGELFEASAVVFLFALSNVLEAWSVGRARRAISKLMDLSPVTARYICPHDGDIMEKPVEEIPVGVTALVRPGEKVPLDGRVTKGATTVNQAPITGESVPVEKGEGDEVFAGTINEEGALQFTVTKAAGDTTLARIIHMVEEAQTRRARSEQWVEKFARYYTPAVMVFAVGIAVFPPMVFGDWTQWFYQALVMLVIACPCALVISTPVSVVAGLTSAARAGVLIKGGIFLEAPARLRAIAIDKTGTLTYGLPEVQGVYPFNGYTEEEVLMRAAALEAESGHAIARSIVRAAERRRIAFEPAGGVRDIKGKGAEASLDGRDYWIGSHRLMHEKGGETPLIHAKALEIEDAAHTVVALGYEDHVCGLIAVADGVRETAAQTVSELRDLGVEHVIMLTGDNRATAAAVAAVVGIEEFKSELLPEEKVRAVEELTRKYEQVAMVGDGVNDAPAMVSSSLAIAMGAAGTDVAIETADVALMSDDLPKVPWLVRHSRRTLAVIKQNIAVALLTKAAFMILALLGLATLWMAIAADMGVSLLVIFNGLRLLRG